MFRGTVHQDVIQVNEKKRQAPQHRIHQLLKSLYRTFKPKGHLHELKEAKRGGDGSLWQVAWMDWHLVLVVAWNPECVEWGTGVMIIEARRSPEWHQPPLA